jgi:5'-3' exonuclease
VILVTLRYEDKLIFSSDRDLTQLISENVSIYSPSVKATFKHGDRIKFDDFEFPHYNVKTLKILTGDKSDKIEGIYLLGEKTLVKLFPDMLVKPYTINEIRVNAGILMQEKKSKVLENILTGKTKNGIIGEEFYTTNKKIVDLSNPLITKNAKELVDQIITDTIDPTDRGYKNLMRLMMEDGLFKYLPKNDEAWVNFLRPFMKLTRKEKRNTNKN